MEAVRGTIRDMSSCDQVARTRRASRELVRELGLVRDAHETTGCTASEGHALIELSLQGSLSVQELATLLRFDKSSASRVVQSLLKKEQVSVAADARDRRLKRVTLTPQGRRLVEELDLDADRLVATALSKLDDDMHSEIGRALELYAAGLRWARQRLACAVRELRPDDNAAMIDVLRRVRGEFEIDKLTGYLVEPEEMDIHGYFERPGAGYWVVEKDSRVTGGAGIGALDGGHPGICELQRMYLLPELRGLGMGAALLERCLQAARELGYEACYAETLPRFTRAGRLFEKQGFESLDAPLGATGHTFTTAWYLLQLSPRAEQGGETL